MPYRMLDVECYSNYFLILAKDTQYGTIYRWEQHDDKQRGRNHKALRSMLDQNTTVTFNGLGYDWWMISAYLQGRTNSHLKELSDWLIKTPMAQWKCEYQMGVIPYKSKHLDLMPVAPLVASLKIYAGRLNAPKLQDLPVAPHKTIDERLRDILVKYCANDVHATEILFRELVPQIKLRYQMSKAHKIDLKSKSDPAIAEGVIKRMFAMQGEYIVAPHKKLELVRRERAQFKALPGSATRYDMSLGNYSNMMNQLICAPKISNRYYEFLGKVPRTFRYDPPDCVVFESPEFNAALELIHGITFNLSDKGSLRVPPELRKAIRFNGGAYKMGIGGLHSTEKCQSIVAKPGQYLTDLDVTSYYPSLILNNALHPAHISDKFIDIYRTLVTDRIAAKHKGDTVTADSLKIVINSSFGKFGNRYSALYSPRLLLQTTISGQLYLLMLIEMIELHTACRVVSANTDGITVFSPSEDEYANMQTMAESWEEQTYMTLEQQAYSAVHSQDVNNYVAIKTDGTHKGKGLFAAPSISKSPNFPIVQQAVIEHCKSGTPIEQTIRRCTDITQFISLRKVTGGAVYRDDEVGSTVRWYLSRRGSPILYRRDAKRVSQASKAQLVNDLPDQLPTDIDYNEYIAQANDLLKGVGVTGALALAC